MTNIKEVNRQNRGQLDRLMEGNFHELQINLGQGILYDEEDNQLYLASFYDEDHTEIQLLQKVSEGQAMRLLNHWTISLQISA